MNKNALLSVALLAMTLVSHVHAQAAVEDPGYCAEFYPNARCRNLGPGNPYADGGQFRLASELFREKIHAFQFPEAEDVVPLALPSDGMTVP